MSDPIDRDGACKALMDDCHIRVMSGNNWIRLEEAVSKLCDLPSAQPEVIRCKDCKHYVVHSFFGRSQGWCERLCDEFDKSLARGTEPDDYCSRAEPYKGEQE